MLKQLFLLAELAALYSLVSSCPQIVTRSQWRARAPKSRQNMATPVNHVFIHHTAGQTCSTTSACSKVARDTQNFHMNKRGWADLGYNFLVGGDGKIYEGRGWNKVGAHTVNYNSKAIAISFMGNFDKTLPSAAMRNAARQLIDCGVKKGYIRKTRQIHGHRDAACTACPGAALYNNIKTWPGFKAGRLPGYKC